MAKDVITRFKLETTGFDSKIKEAAKELSAYSKTATQAKEGFNQFTKSNIDAAKALGTIATSSTTAKDRAKELVGAFNDAAKAYNSLTKEQQQSDWAKALAGSLTQLQQRIKETKAEMQGLGDSAKGGIFSGLGSKMEGALAVFGGNLMTKAAGAIASLGSEMADMVKQGVEMAKAGEGIRNAFERLGRGDILQGLREATHGTVTDLELMKAAVKFNDFKLPIEELGTMLAFAQQKAKDTGQSVDYMVDSIVTGLGRKSLMILDNLGLSATEIRERMKETGDMTKAVGSIIRDQMAKAGDYVETAADRAAQANVSLQNKMEELGRKFGPVEEASNQLWTSMKIGILDVVGGPLARLLNGLTEAGRLKNALNDLNGEDGSGNTKVSQQLKKLQAIKKAGGSDYIFNSTLSGMKEGYNSEIAWREQYAKDIQAWQSGKRSDALSARIKEGQKRSGSDFLDAERVTTEANAYKVMLSQLLSGAKDITNPRTAPTTPVVPTTKPTKTTKTDIQYADDSIMAQEKLVSDLTQKWKTASGEMRDGYLKDLEEAQKKLAKMTGKAKDDGAPTFTMAQLEGISLDNQMPTTRGNNGKAQDKLDLATAAFATGGTSNVDFSNYTSALQNAIKDANIGSELYTQLSEQLSDSSQVSQLLHQYVASGITGADLAETAQELKEKLMNGEIDDDVMQQYVDELNAKLMEKFDEAEWPNVLITFDADTKNIVNAAQQQEKEAQKMAKNWQSAGSAIQSVGQAMNAIEDPAAKVLGTIAQAVASVALGAANAMKNYKTFTGWDWIAFAAASTATMISTIASIHSATGYANGGIYDGPSGFVPGNKYSGDLIPANGGTVSLSSGELILNRAQQGVIAAELEGGSGLGNIKLEAILSGEDIILVANNRTNRVGYQELLKT